MVILSGADASLITSTDSISDVLIQLSRERKWKRLTTVSDSNTYPLIAREIHSRLQESGITSSDIILNGHKLIADERSIVSVLTDLDNETDAFVSVGSGTITDIVRFISHRLRKEFVSVPTAPSIDGYTSIGAPLMLKGFKRNIKCHVPSLVIASPSIITNAPSDMIAAGFGDIMGKIISVSDWELAHLLTDAPFDREIANETLYAFNQTVDNAAGIAQREQKSIMTLFTSLTKTGELMGRFGSSQPASGSEHHISHFLEMQRFADDKPTVLHGLKVGIGTIIAGQWYRSIREMDRNTIAGQLTKVPDYQQDMMEIRSLLGEPGKIILENNTFLSTLDEHRVARIRKRMVENWQEVQSIAAQVPEPEFLAELFKSVGGPSKSSEIGISKLEVERAARLSHYVRSSFTVKTMLYTLCLPSNLNFRLI